MKFLFATLDVFAFLKVTNLFEVLVTLCSLGYLAQTKEQSDGL